MSGNTRRPPAGAWSLFLLVPVVGLTLVPSYDRPKPELAGIPFYYWYQLTWIFFGIACTGTVCAIERRRRARVAEDAR